MTSRPRRFHGFAALNGRPDGPLIWGSLRTTEDAARQFFERHNPQCNAVIVPVEIRLSGSGTLLYLSEEDG